MKGFQQAFTGNNYITGEHLSAGDRWGEGIGATLSIIPIPGLKHAGKYGTKGVIWAGSKLKNVLGEDTVKTTKKLVYECNCFTAGTKVLTDEGEKPIEEIEVGDKVLSKDDETGEVAYKEVVGLFQKQADEIYYVHIGDEIIEVTGEHPFWLDGKGWTFVKDLKVGDLLVSSDGTKLAIDKIEKESREATVYNFEVEDFNSYFVSNLGIWVHNCAVKVTGDGGPNFSPNFDKKLRKHARDIYETSRDLGVPVKKGDKEWMEEFILSIVNEPQNLANSKPFKWNTIESVDAFVMGDAVVLVNRDANEILTFLNKKGNRLSSMLISELDLIRE